MQSCERVQELRALADERARGRTTRRARAHDGRAARRPPRARREARRRADAGARLDLREPDAVRAERGPRALPAHAASATSRAVARRASTSSSRPRRPSCTRAGAQTCVEVARTREAALRRLAPAASSAASRRSWRSCSPRRARTSRSSARRTTSSSRSCAGWRATCCLDVEIVGAPIVREAGRARDARVATSTSTPRCAARRSRWCARSTPPSLPSRRASAAPRCCSSTVRKRDRARAPRRDRLRRAARPRDARGRRGHARRAGAARARRPLSRAAGCQRRSSPDRQPRAACAAARAEEPPDETHDAQVEDPPRDRDRGQPRVRGQLSIDTDLLARGRHPAVRAVDI